MYVSAADNNYVGVAGTFLGTPSQGVCSTAFSVPRAESRSLRRVYPRPGAAVGGHAGPVQHADQGQRLRGRLGLPATSGGVSTGSVVCGDVTSSGTVSAPQLFASNTLIVTNTSDFLDDLFLTKNWAGWSKLQVSNNSAASDSGPERAGLPGARRRGAPVSS